MAGEAPAVNALRMEAQSLEEVLALLQAKVGALRGDGAETLSGDARRQLQGVARGALAALQQRQAGARASGAQPRASSTGGGSVSSSFGGVFSRAGSATSSVGARSSGGASIASIPEGGEEGDAPSGLLAQLQLKSKQMGVGQQPPAGRPSAGSFTGVQSPNGSSPSFTAPPPATLGSQTPKMPQFGVPGAPPRAVNNGGWQAGYAKEGFPGVDAIRQLNPAPVAAAPAPMVRPNLPQTLTPPNPVAAFGSRPVAPSVLQPGFPNPGLNPAFNPGLNAGPAAGFNAGLNPGLSSALTPGLNPGPNPGFASRPVAPNGFNMASVASQPVVRPPLAPPQAPAAPVKTGGSLAEQLAARAGNLKSATAPPPTAGEARKYGRKKQTLTDASF